MIALLLDLDSPSPNSEHELWVKNKQVLAGELWKMRQTGAQPRADSNSYQPHPTNASSVDSGPSSRIQHDSGSGVLGPHFGASTTSYSLDSSDHWSDVFGNESSNDSESTHFSISDDTGDTTSRDPSQLTSTAFHGHKVDLEPSSFMEPQMGDALGLDVSRDADGDSEDAQPTQVRRKSSQKEHVVLGRLTLAEVWLDMSKTTLPSWIGHAPPELGNGKHGKLSADQWRTACTVNLVVTLLIKNFGPPHAWACFVFERCEVRILMQSADLPPVFHDLQAAFAKAFDAEARRHSGMMWAFTSDFNLPIIKGTTEIPLPTLVEEKLRVGLLDGVLAAHFPSVCLMEESFTYCGMKFSVETNSPGNSFVVFKYERYQPWSAGSIQMILYLPIKGTTHGPFFVIKPYLPLNTADAQLNPYRKFIFAAGQLVYKDRGDPVVVSLDEVICHFTHTPFTPTNISR
ncbi:hypothetical protein EDB86DRAFT_2829217 [Lactarius hatsudake]|nr:hypothetical protein EDB86DRAFT_2829217 [Lactarius hatsudake]